MILGTKYKRKGKYILLIGTERAGKTWLGILEILKRDFWDKINSLSTTLDNILISIKNQDHYLFLRKIQLIEEFYEFKYVEEKVMDFLKKYKKVIKNFNEKYGVKLKGDDIIEDTYLAVSQGVIKEYLELFEPLIKDLKEKTIGAIKSLNKSYTVEKYPVKTGKGWVTLKVIPGEYTKDLERMRRIIRKYDKIIVAFGPLDFYVDDPSLDIFLRKNYEFLELLKGKKITAVITMADDEFISPDVQSLYIWRDNIKVNFKDLLKNFLKKHPMYQSMIQDLKVEAKTFFKENLSMNPSKDHWDNVMYEILSILVSISPKKIYYVSSLRKKGKENFIKAIESLI